MARRKTLTERVEEFAQRQADRAVAQKDWKTVEGVYHWLGQYHDMVAHEALMQSRDAVEEKEEGDGG